ncbi:unannotated protein [freshwater metagenome]|uniref:Unannotated protein n=1 Tax=freshwater metagenome TaxID=449393 RepID=A0A6J6QJ25_9ZZZZ
MTDLFERSKRVPRTEQEARVVSSGDAAADDGWKVFQFCTDADKGAVDAGID